MSSTHRLRSMLCGILQGALIFIVYRVFCARPQAPAGPNPPYPTGNTGFGGGGGGGPMPMGGTGPNAGYGAGYGNGGGMFPGAGGPNCGPNNAPPWLWWGWRWAGRFLGWSGDRSDGVFVRPTESQPLWRGIRLGSYAGWMGRWMGWPARWWWWHALRWRRRRGQGRRRGYPHSFRLRRYHTTLGTNQICYICMDWCYWRCTIVFTLLHSKCTISPSSVACPLAG